MDDGLGWVEVDPAALDRMAAAAIVAQEQQVVAGWWCRSSPDVPFRRASAAIPPAGAGRDPVACRRALAQVVAWCAARRQRPIVQVSEADPAWATLDAVLEDDGLAREAPVHVMVRGGSHPPVGAASGLGRLEVTTGIDERWTAEHGLVAGVDERQQARAQAYGRLLAAHGSRAVGASLRVDGQVVGVGFGVIDGRWLGIFGMATTPAWRRHGVASTVVHGLQAVAIATGAEHAYLQVEVDNEAALGLYRHLGFSRSHGYHYRSGALEVGPGGR